MVQPRVVRRDEPGRSRKASWRISVLVLPPLLAIQCALDDRRPFDWRAAFGREDSVCMNNPERRQRSVKAKYPFERNESYLRNRRPVDPCLCAPAVKWKIDE